MMKSLLVSILFLVGFESYGQECIVSNAKTENVFEYLKKMAESLAHIKIQFQKIKSVHGNEGATTVDALVALKELQAGYFCSATMISNYRKSKDRNIARSAETLGASYQMLGSNVNESISDIKSSLDGKGQISPGEQAERDAEKIIDVKKKWEIAILAIGLGTHSAIDNESSPAKRRDALTISKLERDEVVKILKMQFILPNKNQNFDPIDMAANIYFNFLNQPWKFK
ncbi:MAG: hypothetical protein J0L93_00670 [Deltaproteobacteria bacterium]|nr:hypothetical protein [Deltaproteobacteria bacterium]